MPLKKLKRTIPNSVKKFLKDRLIGQSARRESDVRLQQDAVREVIKSEVDRYLRGETPNIRVGLRQQPLPAKTDASKALFEDFFVRYGRMREAGQEASLSRLKADYPVAFSTCDRLYDYLSFCDRLKSPLAGALRRLCYFAFPFMNSPAASQIYSYKQELPRVGIVVQCNPEPRKFITDALEGICLAEEVTSETLIAATWSDRPYDFLAILKEEVASAVAELPAELVGAFPSKDWLIDQVAYHCQAQIGLKKLIEENRWDALIAGSTDAPVCLALMDIPPAERPPLVLFYHGIPPGDPFADLFAGADYALARGNTERQYYIDLGLLPERIVKIGSLSRESFCSRAVLASKRQEARLRCGIDLETPVFFYALQYDLHTFKQRSPEQIAALIVDSFKSLAKQPEFKECVLFLKYHPAPADDPYFSFSRRQYPLETFLELAEFGISVRLVTEIDDSLQSADCFIHHESTLVGEALFAGVPTISLNFQNGIARSMLGVAAYESPNLHSFLSVWDTPQTIAAAMSKIIAGSREDAYESCLRVWRDTFDCPRTEGLARLRQLVLDLTASKQTPSRQPAAQKSKCSLP